jgi:hypothetical protein
MQARAPAQMGMKSDSFGAIGHLRDFVASSHFTFLQYAEVKSGPMVCHKQSRHFRFSHPDAHAIACDTWLRDLEERAPNPVSIADANLVVGQAHHCEVLAKLSECKIVTAELSLPVAIGIHLIHHHRAAFASMPGYIALSVALHIQTAD